MLLEYLRFGFLSLFDHLSGLRSTENSPIISDIIGAKFFFIGDFGALSGIREFVGDGIFLPLQAQLPISLNLTSPLMITLPLIGLYNLYALD